MHRVVGLTVAFFILSAVFSVLESLFASNKTQKRFRAGYKTDLVYWFWTPIVTQAIALAATALTLCIVFHRPPRMLKELFLDRQTWITTHLPVMLQIALLLLIGDILGYWMHRWFHGRRLWKFHAVHHCSQELDWLSSVRLHPVNDAASRAASAVVLLALGFNPVVIAAYLPFLTFYALLIHANVSWDFGWLGQLITSPRFHRWHHTSQEEGLDKNFSGLFPWIDRIFGTYYMPKGKQPEKFGLYGEQIPESFWGQMTYPFKKKQRKAAV
jgi:sterol desaturase/sphingolipid hydroxylase (fatty acid hydroxylase superfamily)